MCPNIIVNDFVTNTIKTVPLRMGYNIIRVTLKNEKITDKTLMYCSLTTVSIVSRRGCLVNVADVTIKSAPKNKRIRENTPFKKLFEREVYFYNTVMDELFNFQELREIENGFQGTPFLVGATLDDGEEAMVLVSHNSDRIPRFEKWVGELSQEHIVMVLKEFARFHALNFAFAKTNPMKFEEFKNELQESYLSTLENKQTLNIIHSRLRATLKLFTDENIVSKLRKFDEEVDSFLESALNGSSDVQVLLHGDPTTSILFSYEKTIKMVNVLTRTKFFDWQLVKFGSPVLDLSLFLFINCSSDDLNNLKELLKEYHNCLNESLQKFKCHVDDFLPFERLEEQWKKYAKFGFALSLFTLGVITQETNKRPNSNSEDLNPDEFFATFDNPPNSEFARRIKDIVRHCIDTGIL